MPIAAVAPVHPSVLALIVKVLACSSFVLSLALRSSLIGLLEASCSLASGHSRRSHFALRPGEGAATRSGENKRHYPVSVADATASDPAADGNRPTPPNEA
jgi:hypothetical protein